MGTNFSATAAFIWSVADLLRGDFKQSQYGRIILPFTILRRLECVLEDKKEAVLLEAERIGKINTLSDEAREKFLRRKSCFAFYNLSPMNLAKLGAAGIKDNLNNYIHAFSKDAREIFEYFKFDEFVAQLNDAGLLFKVVEKFATTDLSPKAVSNHEMGLVFEELIRRFAESSNETAGEHFTPRDIVRLTTSLVFMEDDDALTKTGVIRTIYDPTAGTGGFLSSGMEYVYGLNPNAVMRAFGQELYKKAIQLQAVLGKEQFNDYQDFETKFKDALKQTDVKLDNKEKKQFDNAITWENQDAEPVIKKVHKNKPANPLYGLFEVDGQTIEYKASGNLRDNENIPLDPSQPTIPTIETYFKKEVAPHVSDSWIDASKCDKADGEIGIVGYEIPFNRHFYQYVPPRSLEEIDSDLDVITKEIMKLLQEVHS